MRLKHLAHRNSGFTLIEIMIVVMIIAMLIMIAVPAWMGARERSQTRACISQMREIKYAKESWAMENKKSQDTVAGWDDIKGYLKNPIEPVCPAGGTYTIGVVSAEPICSIGGKHVLY